MEAPEWLLFLVRYTECLSDHFPTIVRSGVRILVWSSAEERAQGAGWGRHCPEIQCFSGNHSRKFEVSELFFSSSFCRNPDLNIWTPTWLLHRCVDKPSLALPPRPSPQPLRAPVFVLPASCLLHTALWGCAAWTEKFLLRLDTLPASLLLCYFSPSCPL